MSENRHIGFDLRCGKESFCFVSFWNEGDKKEFVRRFKENELLGILKYISLKEENLLSVSLTLTDWTPIVYLEKYQKCLEIYKNTSGFWGVIVGSIAYSEFTNFFLNDKNPWNWEETCNITVNNKTENITSTFSYELRRGKCMISFETRNLKHKFNQKYRESDDFWISNFDTPFTFKLFANPHRLKNYADKELFWKNVLKDVDSTLKIDK